MKEYDISKAPISSVEILSESERLRFAKQVLLGLALISFIVFIAYFLEPDNKAIISIFELVKIGVLPLATLVVTFYFPNSVRK